jgi:ferrous iron transport protein A
VSINLKFNIRSFIFSKPVMELKEQTTEVKPLSEIPEGKTIKVVQIEGGRGIKCRLEGLGIYPGQTIKVLRNKWGPVLVESMGRKIAIGRGQANKILVEEIE